MSENDFDLYKDLDYDDYFKNENLNQYIKPTEDKRILPKINDLSRLHRLILHKKPKVVLEFGVGWSTLIIADAICKLNSEFEQESKFEFYSIDSSQNWIEETKKLIPYNLKKFVNIHFSDVLIKSIDNQLCSQYNELPDIVPEFIYLDGPNPKDVHGSINGLSFENSNRTVISADIILMESTFVPPTSILIDGRTNNSRFLHRMLKRNWDYFWDSKNDISIFNLIEEPLSIK